MTTKFQSELTANRKLSQRINAIIVTIGELKHQAKQLTSDNNEFFDALLLISTAIQNDYYELRYQCSIDYSESVADSLFIDLDNLDFELECGLSIHEDDDKSIDDY